jgi:hypothetical protein
VSVWVRDVKLSASQRRRLNKRGFSVDAIEKRRINRIKNTNDRHQVIIDNAKKDTLLLSSRELLLVGSALYWGEGSKANRNVASVANSDPELIKVMMRFFREVCGVREEKFRGHIHTFSHLNKKQAERYWSFVTKIPLKQFYKTYSKPSIASKGKKDSLQYGTLQIYICDTNVAMTIKGWITGLKESYLA